MGEMADDLIGGFSCSDCGVYFKNEHGYPVLCDDCWEEAKKDGRLKKGKMITTDGKQKHIYKEL